MAAGHFFCGIHVQFLSLFFTHAYSGFLNFGHYKQNAAIDMCLQRFVFQDPGFIFSKSMLGGRCAGAELVAPLRFE